MEQVTKLLEQLAIKLGTTVEYLWQVIINQAQVQIQINEIWMTYQMIAAIICGIFLVLTVLGLKFSDDYDAKMGFGRLAFISFVLGVIFIAFYVGNYTENITLRTNPEFWALQEILKNFK